LSTYYFTAVLGNDASGTTYYPASGPDTTNFSIRVNYCNVLADYAYCYGIELGWGSGSPTSYTYGNSSNGFSNAADTYGIDFFQYYLDSNTPTNFVGVNMYEWNETQVNIISCGNQSPAANTAFEYKKLWLADVAVWTKEIAEIQTICGVMCYYNGKFSDGEMKLFNQPSEMAFPALGLMANAMVVAKSLKNVAKLRRDLNVNSSNQPPQGTDSLKVDLWHRTVRAQESCKEMFLLYAPAIVVATLFGQEVFGKWAPRAVGALSLVGAFYRYKYMNASIDDPKTKGTPFRNAAMAMKPVYYLAVVSCGYLVGKEVYSQCKAAYESKKKVKPLEQTKQTKKQLEQKKVKEMEQKK